MSIKKQKNIAIQAFMCYNVATQKNNTVRRDAKAAAESGAVLDVAARR